MTPPLTDSAARAGCGRLVAGADTVVTFTYMYVFSCLAPALAFYILFALFYPVAERSATLRIWVRGLAFSLPLVFLSRLAGSLVPALYGSILSPFHEAADRFLPYALLPGALYALFKHRRDMVREGAARRSLTAFYAGSLSLTGFAEIFHTVEAPSIFVLFALPLLTFSVMLVAPRFWAGLGNMAEDPVPRRPFAGLPLLPARKGDALVRRAADFLRKMTFTAKLRLWLYFAGICLAASLVPEFFRHRQWFFAWPLTLGIALLSWAFALPGLRAGE